MASGIMLYDNDDNDYDDDGNDGGDETLHMYACIDAVSVF